MPAMHRLDWTNAWTGRLEGQQEAPFALRHADIAYRFATELSAGRLPFVDMPYAEDLIASLEALTPRLRSFRHMVLLGIGGSALGARALQKAFHPSQDRPGHTGPCLWIADNIDADTLEAWFATLPARETIVVAVSKSGGTIETVAQYLLAREWLRGHLGESWRENMLLVTDVAHGFMRQEADTHGLVSLPVPDHLGGRYSVLSAVGLVPAAFLGMDWKALLEGALAVGRPLRDGGLPADHPAWRLALWNRSLMAHGYTQIIFFAYIPLWATFGPWFAQLWAESLGKEGKGSMPLPATGVTDQHSLQQMFLDGPRDKGCLFLTCPTLPAGRAFPLQLPDQWAFLKGAHFGDLLHAEALGTRMALASCDVPTVALEMADTGPEAAGRMMALLELATLFTGWLLDINPLDQPAVELGKRLANAKLGAPGYEAEGSALAGFLAREGERQEF